MAKLREWTARYLPLEIIATATALAGGLGASLAGAGPVAIAFAGTWGENAGYYTYALARELRSQPSSCETPSIWYLRLWRGVRRLVAEFGVAELVDSFLARPFLMWLGPVLLGNLAVGIVAGKLAADLVFYAIAIVFYEFGKRREKQLE